MNESQARDTLHQILKQIQEGQNLECPPLRIQRVQLRISKHDSPISLAATGRLHERSVSGSIQD